MWKFTINLIKIVQKIFLRCYSSKKNIYTEMGEFT